MKKLFGAHVSTAGGLHLAMERAHAIGANCAQIFSGSPRSWQRLPVAKVATEKLFSEREKYGVEEIYIHSLYLTNLATENPELVTKSVKAVAYDLSYASHIKASGVILHVGSHQGRGWESVRDQIAELIKTILAQTPDDSTLLIENSAGQKGKVNSELAEIRWLFDQVNSSRLGWCMDTCHAFSAGYGFTKSEPGKGLLVDEIEKYNLWSGLKAIHVNGSQGKLGGGLDRHANLGTGELSLEALKTLLTDKRISHLPLLLEVPGLDGTGPDQPNLDILKKLVS